MMTFVTIMGVAIVLDVAHQIAFGQPWMICISGCGYDFGGLAQLGERLICIQEVAGSTPVSSTTIWGCSSVG